MKHIFSLLPGIVLALPALRGAPAPIPPEAVVVVYNSKVPESRLLARYYAEKRSLPRENIVGLPMPESEEISRQQFNETIRDPLRNLFDERGWWKRARVGDTRTQPTARKRSILVTVCGVPYKVARTPDTIAANQLSKRPFAANPQGDDSSVDSELSLLGVEGYTIAGQVRNPYFRQDAPISNFPDPTFLVVGRLDGPSYQLSQRLVDDAIAVEKTGLWGMAYLDLARKGKGYELGDQWIENIARMNRQAGIPTVIDRHPDTFVTNYPMNNAAVYFGWYAHHRDGPLRNEEFRFKRGAVAVHLHSYSAFELRNPDRRWCGPLLASGATATVGNVYEPFLTLTHHFDILYQRLLQGYTIGEAAHMAIPTLSWQAVLLGDPLYRPFRADLKVDINEREDRDFKILRRAANQFRDEPNQLVPKLRTYANKANSGLVFEALGLRAREDQLEEEANAFFSSASSKYHKPTERLRQDLHIVDVYRNAGNKEAALLLLREMEKRYSRIPGEKAVLSLLNILDPPSPPPARVRPRKKG